MENLALDKVLQGDCRKLLKKFPENSIDLIITSPPYANNRRGSYKGIPVSEYVEWFLPISNELYRILKPDGSFIFNIKERVVNGERGTYVYELVLKMRSQGWHWTEEYLWHKKNTYPGKWPNRFRDLWEHLYHFTKSKEFRMYQDEVKIPIGDWAKKRLVNLGKNDIVRYTSKTNGTFGKNIQNWVGKEYVNPGNVLHLPVESSNKGHGAAFPVALPNWFIELFTQEGDVVLDPFLGSGTTAVSAIRLNRHYIGIELSKEYVAVARNRIKSELSAP